MEFNKAMKTNRLKLTPKRRAIFELLKSERKYLTPRQIWERLNQYSSVIGMPSVYRILQEFHAAKLVEVFVSPESQVNYFYVKQNLLGKSHHFVCTQCKLIVSLENKAVALIDKNIDSNLNVVRQHHYQVTSGLCNECK